MKTFAMAAFVLATAAIGAGAQAPTAPGPGAQTPQSFEKQVTNTLSSKYLLYLPKDYGKDAAAKWPTILFLHGSGESGADLDKVKTHGPPKLIAAGKDFPFIIISPQSPRANGWDPETLIGLLDEVSAHYAVDPDRVYLTGLSMGGIGTWELATRHPERFAAIAPIAAAGMPFMARRLRHIPIWVFHGAKDPTVNIEYDQQMVDAAKAAMCDVKFTIYPDAGHNSWTATYDNPELYTWFLSHTRYHRDPNAPAGTK